MKTQEHIDAAFSAALAASAPKAMYTGAAIGGAGWILSSEGLAFCGLLMAALGTAVTVYVSLRRDRRDAREHQARMLLLQQQADEQESA